MTVILEIIEILASGVGIFLALYILFDGDKEMR